MNEQPKKSFKDTLNLPTTNFEIRANPKKNEPLFLKLWLESNTYKKANKKNESQKKFILNDGPPYANGHIHIGTSLNKILKDIVLKYKRMSGFHAPFKLVWDCHGLPIELKVAAELGGSANEKELDPIILKVACRDFAYKWIQIQKEEFKNIGVFADFDHISYTMHPRYQADIMRAFAKEVKDGYIERKGKTVPWCFNCQTVLASAEIEHVERKDPSIFVLFQIDTKEVENICDKKINLSNLNISFLVWTTTPWTLPLNRAIALNPNAEYALIKGKEENQALIVVKERAEAICKMLEIPFIMLAEINASSFKNKKVQHPFIKDFYVPVLHDGIVLTNEGTGVLHMAPGCGPEDYLVAIKNNIEIFSPITPDGKYDKEILPTELSGMKVTDGQIWVLKKLTEVGTMIYKSSIKHSYPTCWRCHNGLIFRATDQWFCNLSKNNLIDKTLKEIQKINFFPETGRARLSSTISSRTEWCISRQRQWGIPIVALLCEKCNFAYLDSEFINHVANKVEEEGIEYWDSVTLQDLVENNLISHNFKCLNCNNADLNSFKKEKDILDVWFDSGVSHFAVLKRDPELGFPADLYLEGSDQHRGWFQSSLLTSMILNNETCTKTFLTHGYVVDKNGRKMSKSLGNVITPKEVVEKYSTDILRLWVASSNYESDIVISETLLNNVAEVYRRIRNTCRFLLSNIYDFDFEKDKIEYEKMLEFDKYALSVLFEIDKKIKDAYEAYDFSTVFHTLGTYCSSELSAFYLDIIKDRLYVEKNNGILRRSAQTACYYILDTLTKLSAPILSFLAEEVSDFYQKDKVESIHLQSLEHLPLYWSALVDQDIESATLNIKRSGSIQFKGLSGEDPRVSYNVWTLLLLLRKEVLKALEEKREEKIIGHSLDAKVTLYIKEGTKQGQIIKNFLNQLQLIERERFLKDFLIVSQTIINDTADKLTFTELGWLAIKIDHADGEKCPRCWQWDTSLNEDNLCLRCYEILD